MTDMTAGMKSMKGFFADERYYKLLETSTWPSMEISGIRMHRVESAEPKADTMMKVAKIMPIRTDFVVLDICTGLGYTAIEEARYASKVITIERDKNVLEVAKQNKYSAELFNNKKIQIMLGDATEILPRLGSNSFDRIMHDPPSLKIAGYLYSGEFYKHLCRILKPNGKLFHYTGEPGRSKGVDIAKGVAKRLKQAGFRTVNICREELGVQAIK